MPKKTMPRRGRAPRNSDNFFYKLLERLHEMDDVESPAFFEQISNYFNYLTPGEQLNENDNVILYGMLYNQLKFYIENLYNELKNSPNLTREELYSLIELNTDCNPYIYDSLNTYCVFIKLLWIYTVSGGEGGDMLKVVQNNEGKVLKYLNANEKWSGFSCKEILTFLHNHELLENNSLNLKAIFDSNFRLNVDVKWSIRSLIRRFNNLNNVIKKLFAKQTTVRFIENACTIIVIPLLSIVVIVFQALTL